MSDWSEHLADLNRARELRVNYDPQAYLDSKTAHGWVIDHHHGHLGFEKPGPPGPLFERAVTAVRDYRFPDPKLVTGYFDPNAPLLGRNMLLEAHFLGLTFKFLTRVTEVIDKTVTNELGHPTRLWGFSYQTLQGHFEEGQMSFSVAKDLASGEVSFHIDAYSKLGRISNLFYRIGFHIFKRPLQKRYIRTAILRMQELTKSEDEARN